MPVSSPFSGGNYFSNLRVFTIYPHTAIPPYFDTGHTFRDSRRRDITNKTTTSMSCSCNSSPVWCCCFVLLCGFHDVTYSYGRSPRRGENPGDADQKNSLAFRLSQRAWPAIWPYERPPGQTKSTALRGHLALQPGIWPYERPSGPMSGTLPI